MLLARPAVQFTRALETSQAAFGQASRGRPGQEGGQGSRPGYPVMIDLIQNYDAAVVAEPGRAVRVSHPQTGMLSNTCSGTAETSLQFSRLSSAIRGQAQATARGTAPDLLLPTPDTNPSDAPYPMWSPTAAYATGCKVVENGEIYQSRWFNTGEDPSAQAQYDYQTP